MTRSIEEIVAIQWQTTLEEMHTKKQDREVAEARHIVMWYVIKHRGFTIKQAGNLFSKHRNSARYAVKTVDNLIETDRNFRERMHSTMTYIKKIGAKMSFELN